MSQESARLVSADQGGPQNGGRSKSSHRDASKKTNSGQVYIYCPRCFASCRALSYKQSLNTARYNLSIYMHRYSMELGETVSEFDDQAPLLSGDFVKYVHWGMSLSPFQIKSPHWHLCHSMQLTFDKNRSVVFGGLDGLITILAIISGAAGTLFCTTIEC